MDQHVIYFFLLALLIVLLCAVTAWSRKNRVYRWGAILCGIAILAGSYPLFVDLLSRPKDVSEEWAHRTAKEALVTGVYIDEGTALYLYLKIPDIPDPRSYKLPWSEETKNLAKSIQEGLDSPEGAGGLVIENPFMPSLERKKPLVASPIPPLRPPPKRQPKAPFNFKGGSSA